MKQKYAVDLLEKLQQTIITMTLSVLCTGLAWTHSPAKTQPDSSRSVEFAIVTDMPYSDKEDQMLTGPDGAIFKALRQWDPPVLIHMGDFKSGRSACTDALLHKTKKQLFHLNPNKVVYTPGDNDWTDCDRKFMSTRFDELERLDVVRHLFFQDTQMDLSQAIPHLVRQEGVIENAMWRMDDLLLATLHLPGTNNGRAEILKSPVDKALDEADRRDATNLQWLETLFDRAVLFEAVVIAFQADIYRKDHGYPDVACSATVRQDCDGLKTVRDAITQKTKDYQKPVLVIHGDTNAYCFYRLKERASNLWRFNAPGDFKVSDGAKVTFVPGNAQRPFQVTGLLDPNPPPEICDYSR